MKRVVLDKIGSVTLNCRISKEVLLSDDYACQEGDVIAVRVKSRKSTYNQLELSTGRFSQLKPGDVVAGALGHRRALLGYAGDIPKELHTGDTLNFLNIGGVLGICTSQNPDLGPPFDCEVLGQVLHFPYIGERIGVPANIKQGARTIVPRLNTQGIPVVAVVGTCMNSGKTYACTAVIQEFTRAGLKVHAAKATGVSLRRDVLAMEDAGAADTMVFTDLGVVTTQRKNAPDLTRSMLSYMAEDGPDVIVLELGDGLMGEYGVDTILADRELREAFTAIVLAANDPVGAWGGLEILKNDYHLKTTLVTGPATDNAAGTDLIEQRMGCLGVNARTAPGRMSQVLLEAIGVKGPREEAQTFEEEADD